MTFWLIYFMCGVCMYVYLALHAQNRKLGHGLSFYDLPEFQYGAIIASLFWPAMLGIIIGGY